MDKKSVFEIVTKLYEVCEQKDDCFDCPFEDTFENSNRGGLCLITSLLEDACVNNKAKYEQVKQELQKLESQNSNGFFKSLNQLGVMNDNIDHPNHYCKGGLECIQVIKAQLTPEQYKGYLYGNVLKYMWRWQDKNGLEDLRKAEHYLKWLMEEVKK